MHDERPLWVRCQCCDCFWCTRHQKHAHDCDCPSIEHLDFDPYSEGGPMPAGRPKLAEQRTTALRLRTTKTERDQLAAAAQAAGIPLARWAREALLIIAAQQRGEE